MRNVIVKIIFLVVLCAFCSFHANDVLHSRSDLGSNVPQERKVTFPLVWINPCCSHPLYRESELVEEEALGAQNAAQRKLSDELGIPAKDVPVDQFILLSRMLYKARSDGKWGVNPDPDEVAEIKYLNCEQLMRKADAGEEGLKLSPWFRLVVDNFLFKWWDDIEKGTLKEAANMKPIHKLLT